MSSSPASTATDATDATLSENDGGPTLSVTTADTVSSHESSSHPESSDSQEDSRACATDSSIAPAKKRKATYYVRKEEKAELEKEIEELQARIKLLEATHVVSDETKLNQSYALNALLSTEIEGNNLALAGTQSMISAEMVSRFRNPLDHYVYLPADAGLRKQSQAALKNLKINTAMLLIQERTRFLDPHQPHRHCETTLLKNGDYIVTFFDITPFKGYSSVRTVFDEFIAYVTNQEFSIMEHQGIVSIKETDESCQFRILTSIGPGVDLETNMVMFSKLTDSPDGQGLAHSIGVVDYVDKDDLYPYQPETRIRKDISACVYITQTPPGSHEPSSGVEDTTPGVTMTRFASIRLHRPQFPVSYEYELQARASAEGWCDLMPKVMKERLGVR